MTAKVIASDHRHALSIALETVQTGGLIAFPTDTVYGIGCSAENPRGINRLYEVKNRERDKPIPLLIADRSELEDLVQIIPPMAEVLMERFWPGPLTLIFPGSETLPTELSPTDTIGVRLPDHNFTRQLIRVTGPLATSSANISGRVSAHTADDVLNQVGSQIELVIDGGETRGERASTVVDCTKEPVRILRQGPISKDIILASLS